MISENTGHELGYSLELEILAKKLNEIAKAAGVNIALVLTKEHYYKTTINILHERYRSDDHAHRSISNMCDSLNSLAGIATEALSDFRKALDLPELIGKTFVHDPSVTNQ